MDSVVSPDTAIAIGKLGGLGVLNLEGLWTRYDDPRIPLGEIASMPEKHATKRMQEIYSAPIRPELIKERIPADSRCRCHRCSITFTTAHR